MAAVSTYKTNLLQILMTGGLSLLLFFLVRLIGEKPVDASTSWFIYYFSFIGNFPHFLSSYQLLYFDFRKQFFSNYRYWLASVISPILLLAFLIYGFTNSDIKILGRIVNAMFFFVGWHYIKQVFGVVAVSNTQQKISFSKAERVGLKTLLYSIWAVSWLAVNIDGRQSYMEGFPFTSFAINPSAMNLAYTLLIISGVYCLFLAYKKYLREGRVISTSGLISILALLAWYLPVLYNPIYFLLVPFFHSIQYLYFVFLVKSNQVNDSIPQRETPENRKRYFLNLYGYLILPFITGAVFMWFLPKLLDNNIYWAKSFPQAQPFMFAFTIFINIHHYFIDHAIWRHDNQIMKKYLFFS